MIFENLAKVTGFSPEKIKEHLLALNALQESGSFSLPQKSALMFVIGALTITESYLMNLEFAKKPSPPPPEEGGPKEKCKSCGYPIYWQRSNSGKWTPLDWDTMESHFKTCPQASQWSNKSKNQGEQ